MRDCCTLPFLAFPDILLPLPRLSRPSLIFATAFASQASLIIAIKMVEGTGLDFDPESPGASLSQTQADRRDSSNYVINFS